MRRFFAILICAMLAFSLPIIALAEGDSTEETMPTEQEESTTTEEVETEEPPQEEIPIDTDEAVQNDTPTEEPPTESTEETPAEDVDPIVTEEPTENITDMILSFVKEHFGDISVIGSLLLAALYKHIKDKMIHKAIGTLNNNAVTVAENSNNAIQIALSTLTECKEAIDALMSEFRLNAEDKAKLENALAEAQAYIKTAKLANVEFANELAELLVLANIPNSKKEELYFRHLAAVNAIADAEKTEVIADDGQETE